MRKPESATARVARLMPRLHAEMRDARDSLDAWDRFGAQYPGLDVTRPINRYNRRLESLLRREHRLDRIAAAAEGRELQTAGTAGARLA